jgi:3-oxoacyl-[acyl-carrier-protein] synthase II
MQCEDFRLPHPLGLRRVVVTGFGLVTPLGVGVEHTWAKLLAGHTGIRAIDHFDPSNISCKVSGKIPKGTARDGGFDATEWVQVKDLRKIDPFIVYAIAAAAEAVADAKLPVDDEALKERAGVMVGSGIGGLLGIESAARDYLGGVDKRLSPFSVTSRLINLAAGQIGIKYGFRGPTHATATACAAGAHAIGDAARLIALDDADVMIAGGAEAAACEIGMASFAAARALSTGFNDTPARASRPWDVQRDGFVMGEGSGIVVLEEYGHALARGARIHAEVIGYGLSGDAHHIAAPPLDGNGGARAISAALRHARLKPYEIDYVNAHATSTPIGDLAEIAALKKVFGPHLYEGMSVSSTKGSTGHLLGAAGSIEAVFTMLAMRDQIVPPTLNLDQPAPECEHVDLVPGQAKPRAVRYAMSNSFGFGGTNAVLIFGPPPVVR